MHQNMRIALMNSLLFVFHVTTKENPLFAINCMEWAACRTLSDRAAPQTSSVDQPPTTCTYIHHLVLCPPVYFSCITRQDNTILLYVNAIYISRSYFNARGG